MRFKKGSKEAKLYMAKIRNKKKSIGYKSDRIETLQHLTPGVKKLLDKGLSRKDAILKSGKDYFDKHTPIKSINKKLASKKKKSKLTGAKHQDIKSHNYKINISGLPSGDIDAMREIRLFADNDSQLYFSSKRPILQNLSKKYIKGVFDIDKASKLWLYYIENAMKKYAKEFGGKWNTLLSVHDRKLLAYEYAVETKFEFDLGNFTN